VGKWTEKARQLLGYIYHPEIKQFPGSMGEDVEIPVGDEEKVVKLELVKPGDKGLPAAAYPSYGELIATTIFNTVNSKEDRLKLAKSIENNEYVKPMIRTVANDIMKRGYNPDDFGYFFKVELQAPEGSEIDLDSDYGKDCRNFVESLRLYEYLCDMAPYILLRGERIVEIDHANQEIDELDDQGHRVTLYKRGSYVACGLIRSSNSRAVTYSPTKHVPLRCQVYTYVSDFKDVRLADGSKVYAKVGEPLLSEGTIEKINTLKLLESLIPLTQIVNIDKKLYFYFRVAPGTDVKEGFNLARNYENLLGNILKTEIPSSVEDLVEKVARVKVIPLFGEQKDLEYKELTKPDNIDTSYLNDLRRIIAAGAGSVPPQTLGITDGDQKPSQIYLQMIKTFREGLAECVRWIVYSYLSERDITVALDRIKVKTPKVPGAEELEVVDFMSMFADQVSSVNRVIDDGTRILSDAATRGGVDLTKYVDYLNSKVRQVTGKDVFVVPPPKTPEE